MFSKVFNANKALVLDFPSPRPLLPAFWWWQSRAGSWWMCLAICQQRGVTTPGLWSGSPGRRSPTWLFRSCPKPAWQRVQQGCYSITSFCLHWHHPHQDVSLQPLPGQGLPPSPEVLVQLLAVEVHYQGKLPSLASVSNLERRVSLIVSLVSTNVWWQEPMLMTNLPR